MPTDGPIAVRTERLGPVCQAARIGGILVPDSVYGLGFEVRGNEVGAVWPDGYTARRENGKVLLIGPYGQVVAREGDYVEAGGALGSDGAAHACTGIRRQAPPST